MECDFLTIICSIWTEGKKIDCFQFRSAFIFGLSTIIQHHLLFTIDRMYFQFDFSFVELFYWIFYSLKFFYSIFTCISAFVFFLLQKMFAKRKEHKKNGFYPRWRINTISFTHYRTLRLLLCWTEKWLFCKIQQTFREIDFSRIKCAL